MERGTVRPTGRLALVQLRCLVAGAAGAPIVGLFGPTEWWRNGSPYSQDICVERNDIDCRVDCHRRSCSKWICMDIGVERVFEAVARRIEIGAAKVSHG